MPGDATLSLVWVFLCVLLIVGLAYWFTRYVLGSSKFGRFRTSEKAGQIKPLTRLPLGKDQQLLLVQVGERYFLLGATPHEITSLAEFSPEEAAAWREEQQAPDGEQPPGFREALQTVLKQRMKR